MRRHVQSVRTEARGTRGAVLITALLLSVVVALGLATYLALSRTSLATSHRSYFLNDAHNLAEAGLEAALCRFRRMNAGQSVTDAWSGWTLNGSEATYTLPSFARDQQAVGVVRVFVSGHDGSVASPYIMAQAVISTFDQQAPIVKTLRLTMRNGGYFANGIVALTGLTWNGHPMADSFNSNSSNSPTGPWAAYSSSLARNHTSVVVLGGNANLGALGMVKGDMSIATSVASPPASQVTGAIRKNATGTYTLPEYPSAALVSKSYDLGSSIPATLPVSGHLPADDGKYYYFCEGATLGTTTIPTGKNVVLVGKTTKMEAGLTIEGTGTLKVYMDGTVEASGIGTINNHNWAGALQIFTSTTGNCKIGGNGQINVCLYAPNAEFTGDGGGSSGSLVGSYVAKTIRSNGHMDFHYDEALRHLPGGSWQVQDWYAFSSAADRALVPALSGGFLQ